MIILKIKTGPHAETRVFQKKSILIGAVGSLGIDIGVEDTDIEASHLRITEEDERFVIENLCHDPFATLNELPFGKKTIKNNDLIQLGNTTIVFEGTLEKSPPPAQTAALMYDTSTELVSIVEHRMQSCQQQKNIPVPPSTKEQHPFEWEEENLDVEALLKEVDALDTDGLLLTNECVVENPIDAPPIKKREEPQEERELPPTIIPLPKPSLKRPIQVYDSVNDESELLSQESSTADESEETKNKGTSLQQNRSPLRSPAIWFTLLVAFLSLLAIISAGVYNRIEKKAAQQEIKAAAGISDVALALTYAQINGIKAPKQNWTDPEFLNHTINSVLSKQHRSIAEIDHHGHILNTDYMLRIYANQEMTRFLIIAQPEASLTQWLVPKSSIILDSSRMELHKSKDLKSLNRLLVNPAALNDEGGNSVIALVNGGEIIPLSSLADPINENGFAPPKALEHLRPGAENLVYNAPRYSQVGEQLMQEAVAIVNNHQENSAELRKLQDQLKVVARLPNVVLYTPKGLKTALLAKKALAQLTPKNNYLIAYTRYDNIKGTTSHLIIDPPGTKEKSGEVATADTDLEKNHLPYQLPTLQKKSAPLYSNSRASNAFDGEIDPQSPLYQQITSIQKERKEALQSISTPLIELIQQQNEDLIPNFSARIHLLLKEYENECEKQQMVAGEKLKNIYQAHREISLSDFSTYVKAAGMKGIGEARVKQTEIKLNEPKINNEQLQAYLMKIERSLGFDSLLESTKEVAQVLNLENVPDSNHLARYQNRTRAQTLERLNEFLLSPYSPLTARDFTQKNRALLLEIMKSAWISDTEEQKFYLTEFDHHANTQ